MIKQNITFITRTQKQKQFLRKKDIDDVFKSVYSTIMLNIQKSFERGLSWVIDSLMDRNINGSNYRKLPKEFDKPKKRFD